MKKNKVVIIGSGIGGLVCGAILSKEGYIVTVLERNKQIGGNLQTYARDKCIFDSGVHYVGGLDKGQNLYKIFKYLGIIDKLKMQKLDEEAFDRIIFADDAKEYKYAQGYDKFKETLLADFPEEKEAIDKYCETIINCCQNFPLYQLKVGDYLSKSAFLEIDTRTFIESLTNNKRLRNVLAGNNALYGGIGDKTPIYVHALVLNSYIESAYRFLDGGSQIARSLNKIITDNGGVVKSRTEIKKINIDSGEADYVEATDGVKFYADYVISNAHPVKTLEMLDTDVIRKVYRNRINGLENSVSAFMLNITLKPNTFKYRKTNYYCILNNDVWASLDYTDETWPLSYCLFYSASSKSEEYAESITLMAYMKYEEVEQWKDTFNTVLKPALRGGDYDAFKRKKAEKLIDIAEKKFPGLRNSIKAYYSSTPLSFRDYMGTTDGALYGISKDYKDPLKTFISPRTKIPNVLLTGQNINLHGILGVSISSLITCSEIVGLEYLINKINHAQNQ